MLTGRMSNSHTGSGGFLVPTATLEVVKKRPPLNQNEADCLLAWQEGGAHRSLFLLLSWMEYQAQEIQRKMQNQNHRNQTTGSEQT